MNKKIGLVAGILSLAFFAGCNQTGSDTASSDALTIQGTATNAALEVVTVADAEDSVVATTATEEDGSYTVTVNGEEVTFPLTITVIHGDDTLTKVIEAPGVKGERHFKADFAGKDRAADDTLAVCSEEIMDTLKATVDSLKAELEAGTLTSEEFHQAMRDARPEDCHPAKRHHRKDHSEEVEDSTDSVATDTTASDETETVVDETVVTEETSADAVETVE